MSGFRLGDRVQIIAVDGGQPQNLKWTHGVVDDTDGALLWVKSEGENKSWCYSPDDLIPENGIPARPSDESPTLLDQFAMAALTGLLAKGGWVAGDGLAKESYIAAQAMLKARPQ